MQTEIERTTASMALDEWRDKIKPTLQRIYYSKSGIRMMDDLFEVVEKSLKNEVLNYEPPSS